MIPCDSTFLVSASMGDGNAEYEKIKPLVAPHRSEWFEAPARFSIRN
jgi:hypothetical protein